MVRLVSGLLVVLACFFYSPSKADETGNILDNNNWVGSVTPCSGSACWGGYSGGSTPSWNGWTFRWGYGGGSVHQSIALNQVFSDMGINILGFKYSWDIKNWNANTQFGSSQDPLDIYVDLYDSSGNVVENYHYDYGYPISNWTNFSGTETFTNSYALNDLSNIKLTAEGDDAGYWAGWYGPELTINSFNLVYEVDPCIANPLSSTSCAGYAEAYYDQQCSLDALYDQGCTGYAEAYYNQQCSFDALYDTGCPGYEEAYYQQQCSLDALYDVGCDGYEEAYYNYQCGLDALYDQGCEGYALAFEEQQCSFDPQYSPTCPGYQFPTTPTVEEETIVVVVEEEVQEPVVEQMTAEAIEEDYVEVIEPLTKEKEKENGESKSSDSTTNESDNKSESRKRESALRIGLGVSDRLVAGLVSSSISSGDASAEESQSMNQMLQSDNEAFSQLTQSSSTSTKDDNNSAAGVGPIVVVIIPPESSGGEPTEKQESLAERIAEKVRQANLEKSATYKGQTAMLQDMNSAVDLTAYDQVLTDRDEIYVMSQIYPDNVMKTNNANHYRMRRQNYGVMQELIRSQY